MIPVDTAVQIMVGPLIDDTDFKSRETGVAYNAAGMDIDLLKSNDTGTPSTTAITLTTGGTNDWVELSGGYYYIELTAAQNNTEGKLKLIGIATGILPFESVEFDVVPTTVYNSLIAGSDTLQTDVTQWLGTAAATPTTAGVPEVDVTYWLGTAAATPTTAGVPEVDVTHIAGTAQAATNLEVVFDGNEGFNIAYQGPNGVGVFLDSTAGNSNTTNGVDGTAENPVSTIGAARTICESLGVRRIYVYNATSITLAAAHESYEFYGLGGKGSNIVNLGNQDVDNAYFENLQITGAQAGTGQITAYRCELTGHTGVDILATDCRISGTLTIARDSTFNGCYSGIAGGGTPVIDVNSVANIDLNIRHYSGGVQFNNAVATTTVSLEGMGQVIIGATCTSINLTIRGMFTLTDSGTTSVITDAARVVSESAIRKNRAFSDFEFLMVDSADGQTAKTGLTGFTVERSIDGAAFASAGGTVAEVGNGIYQYDGVAADTNGDVVTWRFAASGALDAFYTFKTGG
jgi:hypothetical protein